MNWKQSEFFPGMQVLEKTTTNGTIYEAMIAPVAGEWSWAIAEYLDAADSKGKTTKVGISQTKEQAKETAEKILESI